MSNDTNYTPYSSLEELLDDLLAENPESPLWQQREEVNAQINRSLRRLKAALEGRLGRVLSNDEFKALFVQRIRGRNYSSVVLEADEWAKQIEQAPAE